MSEDFKVGDEATKYEVGEWYYWGGGGECPVSGFAIIDYVWHDEGLKEAGISKGRKADHTVAWQQVIRFRVIRKEPLVRWVNINKHEGHVEEFAYRTKAEADKYAGLQRHACIKFVEVEE